MPNFLVEVYAPGRAALADVVAAARMADDGGRVRYMRSTFVAADETCFHLFEAPSAEAVAEAIRGCGLDGARVTEASEFPPSEQVDG
jgi:hypothetical protein